MNTPQLLWIEHGFRLPLIIAPLVLIWATRPTAPTASKPDITVGAR